jgi:prepilin-type N-terminal cleavage/methylation domain-containing protein
MSMRGAAPAATGARRGFTLAELLLVVAVLSVAAALVVPSAEPIRLYQLDAAVREIVQALRFAQADAIRTGSPRAVYFDISGNSMTVSGLNMTVKPPTADLVNLILHPVDRKTYATTFSRMNKTNGVKLISAVFPTGTANNSRLVFSADGSPCDLVGPNASDVKPLNNVGQVQLASGAAQRAVSIDPVTGRVTAAP